MIEQCVYDELIQFVLEVVSSEDYLSDLGINRSIPMYIENLEREFSKGNKLKPGIYPAKFSDNGSVHYFAVRNEKEGYQTIVNGYPIAIVKHKNAKGLDVQPKWSHGLCQTFALMYYMNKDHLLKKGKAGYLDNVTIGLKFLKDFIKDDYIERERIWSVDELVKSNDLLNRMCENHSDRYHREVLRKVKGKQRNVSLTSLINFLNRNVKNKQEWFRGE